MEPFRPNYSPPFTPFSTPSDQTEENTKSSQSASSEVSHAEELSVANSSFDPLSKCPLERTDEVVMELMSGDDFSTPPKTPEEESLPFFGRPQHPPRLRRREINDQLASEELFSSSLAIVLDPPSATSVVLRGNYKGTYSLNDPDLRGLKHCISKPVAGGEGGVAILYMLLMDLHLIPSSSQEAVSEEVREYTELLSKTSLISLKDFKNALSFLNGFSRSY